MLRDPSEPQEDSGSGSENDQSQRTDADAHGDPCGNEARSDHSGHVDNSGPAAFEEDINSASQDVDNQPCNTEEEGDPTASYDDLLFSSSDESTTQFYLEGDFVLPGNNLKWFASRVWPNFP